MVGLEIYLSDFEMAVRSHSFKQFSRVSQVLDYKLKSDQVLSFVIVFLLMNKYYHIYPTVYICLFSSW